MNFKSISKNFDHTKTKFLQKYGSTEKTVDSEFEEKREAIEKLNKDLQSIQATVQKQGETLRGLVAPWTQFGTCIKSFFGESEMKTKSDVYQYLILQLDRALREYSEKEEKFLADLKGSIDRITTLKKKIIERDEILLDHDKYKTAVVKMKSKPPKDPSKLDEAESRYNELKSQYDRINAELLEQMHQINSLKYDDFNQQYQKIIDAQGELFQVLSESFNGMRASSDDSEKIPNRPSAPIVNNVTNPYEPTSVPHHNSHSNHAVASLDFAALSIESPPPVRTHPHQEQQQQQYVADRPDLNDGFGDPNEDDYDTTDAQQESFM